MATGLRPPRGPSRGTFGTGANGDTGNAYDLSRDPASLWYLCAAFW